MLDLPSKDKNGKPYLSYSQITLFAKNRKEYYENYILGKEWQGNAYTRFGNKVGTAIETDNYNGFTNDEKNILKQVTRLDEFERFVKLEFDNFYVLGFVDTIKSDYTELIDYKTGGIKKEFEYQKPDYWQCLLYAMCIRQEMEIMPKAYVEFIRREGNAYRGQKLKVANEPPIKMEMDLSPDRIKTINEYLPFIAKKIEEFNLHFKKK